MEETKNLTNNKIMRLKKEEKYYIEEIKTNEEKLNSLKSTALDKYNKKLIEDQIEETRKALKMVQRRLKDFEEGGDM